MKSKLMKAKYSLLVLVLTLLISCEFDNKEDKYFNTPIAENIEGRIAWFPLNGNTNDSTISKTELSVVGTTVYKKGMNSEAGKGIYLNGQSYLTIELGEYDSLAIVLWIKGDNKLGAGQKPVIIDYGDEALTANLKYTLDGTSGATHIDIGNNSEWASSSESNVSFLNSYYSYCFVYLEVAKGITKVNFRGFIDNNDTWFGGKDYKFNELINPQSGKLYIGRSSDISNTSSNFNGMVDEVQIFNRSLTIEELNTFYNTATN